MVNLTEKLPDTLLKVCEAIAQRGGRAVVVGGFVRDHLLGLISKDVDIEVFGLPGPALEETLEEFGTVITVGRAFGVYKVKGLEADLALPRRDSKVAPGHRGFEVTVDEGLEFAEAARRRDFTINSIGYDPLTRTWLDPYNGVADLEAGMLRATDVTQFAEDPLRGMRAAQFIARFELTPDDELESLCRLLDLGELPGERLLEEFRKMLLKGVRPSLGLEFLSRTRLIRHFPELEALEGVPQDAEWHPEGDVWTHTLMVVDEAAKLRTGEQDEAMMFAALCHDLGKPATTEVGEDGRVRSPAHDTAGVPVTVRFLERLRIGNQVARCVGILVATHLAPALLVQQNSGPKAFRRLARKLERAGANIGLLAKVASADHLGRNTPDALSRTIAWQRPFLNQADEALVSMQAPKPVVLGRDLIARGFSPGPAFRRMLDACQEVQDETGWVDPCTILDRVLAEQDRDRS